MKFIVSSSELLKAVMTASKAIPAKTSEPVLENYLFVLKGNVLEITSSDKEITIRTTVEVENTLEEGSIAVPAKQISELLKEIPDQPLTIFTKDENAFQCEWLNGESTLPYFNAEDYPVIKGVGAQCKTISLPMSTLSDAIGNTVYAASDEENRPLMNSIYFDIKADHTTVVASDLQKLICYTAIDVKTEGDASFILNSRHAAVIKSILYKDGEDVSVSFDEDAAMFKFAQTSVTCCLVVGKYPDYTTIIPKNNSNILSLPRTQLLNSVKRVTVCSPKGSNHIKFNLTAGSLEISAEDAGFGIFAHENISCDYNGDALNIGFKATHIIEILSNLTCENVIMKFADKRRAALILPSEEEMDQVKTFGIVMPIMVR